MKFACILLIFALSAVYAYPRVDEWKDYRGEDKPKVDEIKDPKVFIAGGGNNQDGYGFTANVRKNVWQSDNNKHSFDVTGGYAQHLGGPYGNSDPSRSFGGIYTYRW